MYYYQTELTEVELENEVSDLLKGEGIPTFGLVREAVSRFNSSESVLVSRDGEDFLNLLVQAAGQTLPIYAKLCRLDYTHDN